MKEFRLDLFIKEKYNFSREHCKEIILKGYVKVNGKIVLKPSFKIYEDFFIEISQNAYPKYVSRGGLKLEKALEYFEINLDNKVCLDIGASTGGFSDCIIKNNAKKVYAIDVGTSQLDKTLLYNEKIISMENTDIREIENLPEEIDFIATDVSFISLTKIMFNAFNLLKNNGEMVALIK
ncbi:MAG: TlyA family RNA methyltransferase, partial [Eubacteriales bacterium]|nr:TlyA family RNA methyltransferase [Eubacteriales bacterium]